MESGIYIIRNIVNNKCYIGQTNNLKARWIKHKNFLKNNKHHNRHLQAAWNKYGAEEFVFEILEECPIEELDEKETYYIHKYETHINGYNLDEGGQGIRGYKHTEEELAKMRAIRNPLKVIQLDEQLNIVHIWESASQAAKTLKLFRMSITNCCEQKQRRAYCHIWVYKKDYDAQIIDWEYYFYHKKKNV